MWNVLTAQIMVEIYNSLKNLEEQKGCCKVIRGTRKLLYIDQCEENETEKSGDVLD